MPTREEIIERLEEEGHRLTEPRRLIVDLLAEHRGHFTADELWQEGRRQGLSTGRATVFRTLELLAQLGLVDRIQARDGLRRYAVCKSGHHHHLVCTSCGAVVALDGCIVGPQVQALSHQFDFLVEGHHLEFFGQCAQCRQSPS